jgi:O-methyltransferase
MSPAPTSGSNRSRKARWSRLRKTLKWKLPLFINSAYRAASLPLAVLFLLDNTRIHPSYYMTWAKKLRLALRMYRNTRRIQTLTSYKAHLAMAAKLLEIPPEVEGVVVECGCFRGGATANLSLVCDVVGRDLVAYDSFEGLPPADPRDKYANPKGEGFLKAEIEQVKENVRRHGVIERCTFVKGFFEDTLPNHDQPVVLCFLDVDYQASLHDCVLNLWPHLTDKGYVFIDEYVFTDYCALFYSEKYWRKYFDARPPGLLGAGIGVGVGDYYLGPWSELTLIQCPASLAYTRKDFSGHWEYYPDEAAESPGDEERSEVGQQERGEVLGEDPGQ